MKENKLISEFMGFPKEADAVDDRTIAYYVGESILRTDNTDNENSYDVFHPDDMQFHKSWDWLMPVVEKIETLGYWFNRTDGDVTIVDDNGDIVVNTPNSDGGIDIYHKAVVEFINEYNDK